MNAIDSDFRCRISRFRYWSSKLDNNVSSSCRESRCPQLSARRGRRDRSKRHDSDTTCAAGGRALWRRSDRPPGTPRSAVPLPSWTGRGAPRRPLPGPTRQRKSGPLSCPEPSGGEGIRPAYSETESSMTAITDRSAPAATASGRTTRFTGEPSGRGSTACRSMHTTKKSSRVTSSL